MENNVQSPFPYVRDFGQIISATIEFIRMHFSQLYKVLFICIAPIAAVSGIFTSYAVTDYFEVIKTISENPDIPYLWNIFTMFILSYGLLIVASTLCMVFTIEYCIMIHKQGREVFHLQSFIVHSLRQIPRYVLRTIGLGLLTTLASVLLVIPGIYLSVVIIITIPLLENEKSSFWDGVKRSMSLMQGNWWRTLGLILVVYIALAVIGGAFSIPLYFMTILKTLFVIDSTLEEPSYITFLMIFFTMISIVAQVILNSIYHIVFVFKYFSLVEMKEGSSLFTAINQIGSSHDASMPEETY